MLVPHMLTGEAIPAAPLIGGAALEAALAIALLSTVLTFIVCMGMKIAWDHTLGWGLRWLAHQIDGFGTIDLGFTTVNIFSQLADVFRAVDHQISHALAVAALNTENASASLWRMAGRVFWWSVHETKLLSVATFHALEHIVGVNVPDAAKWARREAVAVAHRLVHEEAALRRAADAAIEHPLRVAEADAARALRTAEHALSWSETEIGHLGRDLGGLKAKLERLSRQLTPAAVVALIGATIFKDFGLGWLRCGNVGRMGRAICGMPVRLLEDVLGFLADYLIVTNLCEVVPLLETAYSDIAAPAVAVLTEAIDASPCVSGHQAPALVVPRLHLPATTYLTSSAA